MNEGEATKKWWHTLPGILTGITATAAKLRIHHNDETTEIPLQFARVSQ